MICTIGDQLFSLIWENPKALLATSSSYYGWLDRWMDGRTVPLSKVTLTKAFLKNVQAQILNATSMGRGRLKQNMSMGSRKV